jgi:hypothetical protein
MLPNLFQKKVNDDMPNPALLLVTRQQRIFLRGCIHLVSYACYCKPSIWFTAKL